MNDKYTMSSLLAEYISRHPVLRSDRSRLDLLSLLCVVACIADEDTELREAIASSESSLESLILAGRKCVEKKKDCGIFTCDKEESELRSLAYVHNSFIEFAEFTSMEEISNIHANSDENYYWHPALEVMLSDTSKDKHDRWAKELISILQKEVEDYSRIPSNIYKLMAAPYAKADCICLPEILSAVGLLDIKKNICLEITVRTNFQMLFLARLMYMTKRRGSVTYDEAQAIKSDERKTTGDCFISIPTSQDVSRNYYVEDYHGFDYSWSKVSLPVEAKQVVALVGEGKPASILMPSGLLHLASYRDFRKWLIECGSLKAIVEFPKRVLGNPEVSYSMLLLEYKKNRKVVTMIDAQSYLKETRAGRYELTDWKVLSRDVIKSTKTKKVKFSEIINNDFEISPRRFSESQTTIVAASGKKVCKLSEAVSILRPTPITKDKELAEDSSDAVKIMEVMISDIDVDGCIRSGSKSRYISEEMFSRIDHFRIRPGDILIGTKGTVGKVGLVASKPQENLICGQTMAILRLRSDAPIDFPEYLFSYLRTERVMNNLSSLAGGSSIKFIKAKDLADLSVLILPLEKQSEISEIHKEAQRMYEQLEDFTIQIENEFQD